jgi:CO dehydrogenase/acetyl-CoA synthase epsilon subunit
MLDEQWWGLAILVSQKLAQALPNWGGTRGEVLSKLALLLGFTKFIHETHLSECTKGLSKLIFLLAKKSTIFNFIC